MAGADVSVSCLVAASAAFFFSSAALRAGNGEVEVEEFANIIGLSTTLLTFLSVSDSLIVVLDLLVVHYSVLVECGARANGWNGLNQMI